MGFKDEMLCSKSHEYIVKQDDKYIIGLTDYAIDQLGDIVFLELPEVGDEFKKAIPLQILNPLKLLLKSTCQFQAKSLKLTVNLLMLRKNLTTTVTKTVG